MSWIAPQVPAIVFEVRRDHPVLDRLRERLAEERREEFVLLAGGLDLPLPAAAPVGVGLRVGADTRHECLLVHPREVKHHRRRHHLLDRRLHRRRPRPVGDVGIPRRIDHPPRQDRLPSGLRFGDDPDDRLPVHHRRHKLPVEHRVNPRLLHQPVRHQLEPLGIELVRQRLTLGNRRPHRFRALLELPPDPSGLDRLLVPVPGKPLDPDHRDVAAETAEPLDECHLGPGPCRRDRRRQPARSRSDDQHLRLVDNLNLARGLGDERGSGGHPACPNP